MKVYALVGPSGSGKSHRAGIVAHNNDIPLILDDGLLIWGGKILAGKSSKREESKIAAIRTALLYDQEQAREIKEKIAATGEDSILILGTSTRMVQQIARTLEFDGIDRLIRIEQIASEQDINEAIRTRLREGKHVIPVPTIEVRPKFPGYFINRLELFFRKGEQSVKTEKSIIRPKFSFYGNLVIYDQVIIDILKFLLAKETVIGQVRGVKVEKENGGLEINLTITLPHGLIIPEYVTGLQSRLKDNLENFTGIGVLSIAVEVYSLYISQQDFANEGERNDISYYPRSG